MEILRFASKLKIKAAAGSAKPPRVAIVAYSGGIMEVPGYGRIVIDLAGLTAAATVPLLVDHRNELAGVIGTGEPRILKDRLLVGGHLAESSEAGRQVIALHKDGIRFEASVGVQPDEREYVEAGRTIRVNGRSLTAGREGFVLIKNGELKEVSLTPAGADGSTSVSIAASQTRGNPMAKQRQLQPAGTDLDFDADGMPVASWNRPNLTARERIEARWDAAKFEDENISRRARDVMVRAAAGAMSFDAFDAALSRAERDDREVAILRAERPRGPAIHASRAPAATPQVMAAALLLKCGYAASAEKHYGAQTAEQAHHLGRSHMLDLCRASLQAAAVDPPSGKHELVKASFSTGSMPVALGDFANKVLLDAYTESPATWKSFALVRSANDFHPHRAVRPIVGGEMEQVAPTGEIKHATFGEDTYTYAIDTFGKMLRLDRRDLTNDDLGAFDENARAFGRMAARGVADLAYATLLANAGGFFGVPNGNLLTGGASPLAIGSLNDAIVAMMVQRDTEGRDLDIRPKTLLVPPELATTAKTILQSDFIQRPNNTPTGNALKAVVDHVVEPRLSNVARFPTATATAWYLFGSPADGAVVVAFLDGRQTPVVEFFGLDSDPNTLSATWRVYHDYGVALADPRAAVRSDGA